MLSKYVPLMSLYVFLSPHREGKTKENKRKLLVT